jgi:hypothetical protein
MRVTLHLLGLDGHPRIRFALGSHIQFGSLDFLCIGVDYDLVLLPPSVDIDVIYEALSSLRLYTDEGQAPEGDWPGSSRDRSMWPGKPHGHEKARGQSLTTFYLNPSVRDSRGSANSP